MLLNMSLSISVWRVEPWKMLKRSSSSWSVALELDVKEACTEGALAEVERLCADVDRLMELDRSYADGRPAGVERSRNSADFNSPEYAELE